MQMQHFNTDIVSLSRNLLYLYETKFVTVLSMKILSFPVFLVSGVFQNFRPGNGSRNLLAIFSH